MRPESIPAFTKTMPSFIVAMEACGGAHHLSRLLTARGHTVRLVSPEYVPSLPEAQKNDNRNPEAISRGSGASHHAFCGIESEYQLDMQTLHRARDRLSARERR
jgi:transposase